MATKSKNRIAELNGQSHDEVDTPSVMKPEIVTFHITGISPLLQNNPTNFIGTPDDTGISTKKQYNDEEEAALRVYRDADGNYCHPCQSFTRAMVKAAAGKKFGKMFATNAIKGAVFIAEPTAKILDAKGKPAEAYTIDRQPVVVGKARVLRCRPSWNPWRMEVAFEIDGAILSRAQVLEVLSLAGRIIGIGDFRPEKGGGFGRFRVE